MVDSNNKYTFKYFIKRFLKTLYKGVILLFSIIVVYLIIAFICSQIVYSEKIIHNSPQKPFHEIYITSNGVHTSFIIPYKEFNDFINIKDFKDYKNQKFIMIGWGDEDFYMNVPEWKDLTLKVAIASTLLPTNSAMHVTFISKPLEDENTKKIMLSNLSYQLLVKNIKNSFQLEENKPIIYRNKGYSTYDNFYRAKGNYHAFNTCNSWTNRIMKEAQLKHTFWTPFPFTIMNLYNQ
ncbi:hypothetical protein UJ101_02681 [Flavobacteriaceae bacterium UJ101]|nr:hypothetical protein UJ101_02681 [Flavobacteriaceae bacterium UJ101]